MSKILGLDLGTNSIGWAIRNTQLSGNQIEKVGVVTFNKGVGTNKNGEFSYAAERTKKRSIRRLYQARKYRLWSTLEILIRFGYCPLSLENLNKWRYYNKEEARLQNNGGRVYPVNDVAFGKWIKLDFDGDGKPDFKSPYQLRRYLVINKLDFNDQINRHMLGRALYHIAQRRGFKSSRKNSNDDKVDVENTDIDLQLSERKKNKVISELFEKYPEATTVGYLFACLEDDGYRIREDLNQFAIRQNFKDEIYKIFQFQEISAQSEIFKLLVESAPNKNNGAIFFKRPLRSQKGSVGLCVLEQAIRKDPKTNQPKQVGKCRAPLSHPDFELFRAWQFVNSIKYVDVKNGISQSLPLDLKQQIINEKFFRKSKAYFPFSEIEDLLKNKGLGVKYNYKPDFTVMGCPVSARLREIFGADYLNVAIPKESSAKSKKNYYNIYDIWHVLFSFDDQECVKQFAENKLKLTDDQVKQFVFAWNAMPAGYSMLSLKAIRKINRFLFKGMIYSDAVLLANIPSLVGEENWATKEDVFLESIEIIIEENRFQKKLVQTVNSLISDYKNLEFKFGYKNEDYNLDDSDLRDVRNSILQNFGQNEWESYPNDKQDVIFGTVKDCYQAFFKTRGLIRVDLNGDRYFMVVSNNREFLKSESGFFRLPKLKDTFGEFLKTHFSLSAEKIDKIYHHSDIGIYPPAIPNEKGIVLMGSPKTGSFKNPMAMRTLNQLRKLLNYLIKTKQIDSDTRVVVELARQLNDSNRRWAIEAWQSARAAENREFALAIDELVRDESVHADSSKIEDIDKVRLWYEQNGEESVPDISESGKRRGIRWTDSKKKSFKEIAALKDRVEKYRLWREQKCICIYTGKVISLTDLFNANVIDIEHTIPRSISFDNSLVNKTVTFKEFNRTVKKNRIPFQLSEKDYETVLKNIMPWENKVERIHQQIDYWRLKSRKSVDKDQKDEAIRQRHLWEMELNYWREKVARFKMTSVSNSFKNSQLVDTQIISKYALHYLKTFFEKVDVNNGSHTAVFRRIFGIQQEYTEKDRSSHTHHAKDAAILTLIPTAEKKAKLLKEYFLQMEENMRPSVVEPFPDFKPEYIHSIDDEILINYVKRNQFLTGAKKIVRKRGETELIPGTTKPKISTGDCIRGQLHGETFYGAITQFEKESNGKWKRDEHNNLVKDESVRYVLRVPFKYKSGSDISGFKNWEEIEKAVVDEGLKKHIKIQIEKHGGLKEAFEKGIYLLDSNSNPVGNPIRHVRVWANNLREPLKVKKHGFLSAKEYKQYYYAANTANCYFAIYENGSIQKYELRNLKEAAELKRIGRASTPRDLFQNTIVVEKRGKKYTLNLKIVLEPGIKVIFLRSPEEVNELNLLDLNKRLYICTHFEKDGRLNFKYHKEARNIIEGDYNESELNWDNPNPKLRCSYTKYLMLVENMDFVMEMDGSVHFNKL
jgi:CRISPR-associated endonuclease Csn1